jgi:hypothetical protein
MGKEMAQNQPQEYKHGGLVFEYYTLTVAGTNTWVADGYLKSDPNVTIRTQALDTEREARLAFIDMATEIARSKNQ